MSSRLPGASERDCPDLEPNRPETMRDCASGELPQFRASSMDKEKGRRREAFRGRAVRNDAPGSGEVLPSCFGAGEKAPCSADLASDRILLDHCHALET